MSAQRKELFKKIQLRDEDGHVPSKQAKQLLMDMKVQWSSTYVMLEHAESLREVCPKEWCYCIVAAGLTSQQDVDYFVRRLGLHEKETEKARKLLTMQLTASEWQHVKHFLNLLSVQYTIYLAVMYIITLACLAC